MTPTPRARVTRRAFLGVAAVAAASAVPFRGLLAEPAARPVFRAANPPGALRGKLYHYEFVATGRPRYSLASGRLPTSMTLDPATGVLTGTPRAAGSAVFRIRATNSAGSATTAQLRIHIVAHRAGKPVNRSRPVISDRRPSVGQTISVTVGAWS
jgi:hypothetical protein